jgi:hypothetical protein
MASFGVDVTRYGGVHAGGGIAFLLGGVIWFP